MDNQVTSSGIDKRPERKAGFLQGVVLVSVAWLAVVAAGILSPILPKMAQHFAGAPMLDLMIGFVATIPSLAVALFSIPIGQLSDRLGARRILVIGMTGYGVAGMMPLGLDSLPAIVASRFVVGMCEAAVMTAGTALISLYFSGIQRDRWLAIQVASTNVMGVLAVIAGGLAGEHGWRVPFFAYAIAIVLLVPVLLFTYEPVLAARTHTARAAASAEPKWFWRVALRCALTFFVSVTIYALIVQLSFLLTERGVTSPSTIGLCIAFGAGGIAVGSILNTGLLATPSGYRLLISYMLIVGGLATIALNSELPMICGGSLATGLGAGCAVSTLLCITIADVPAALKGRVTGAWTAAMFFGQFLNPPIFLLLVRIAGSHVGAFYIYTGVFAVVACIGVILTGLSTRAADQDAVANS